jgi:hypothetical protein
MPNFTTFPIAYANVADVGYPVLNVKAYGAVGDGTTDDTAAIQSAIDAAAANNGPKTIYFPTPASPATQFYKCTGQLDFSATDGVTVMGEGGRVEPTQDRFGAALVYTATGSTAFIDCHQSRGLTFRGLAIQCSNASYTGDLVTLDGSITPRVTNSTAFIDCMFGGRTVAARTARTCINASGAVELFVTRCTFGYARTHIVGRASGHVQAYSNAVWIKENRFTEYGEYAISCGGGEQWVIRDNVFEFRHDDGSNPPGVNYGYMITDIALDLADVGCETLVIEGNGFWDCNAGTYLHLHPSGYAVIGNFAPVRDAATFLGIDGGTGISVSSNCIIGSAGGKFIDILGTVECFNDDGTSRVDGGVTYLTNPGGAHARDRTLQNATFTADRVVATGTAGSSNGYLQARATAGNDVVGGSLVVDRNDSTNWRGAAFFSYRDSTLAKEGAAIGIATSTTRPDTTGNKKFFFGEDGSFQNGGGARFMGFTSSAGAPTTTELPNNKDWSIHEDTTGPTMYLAFNLSGTIKKVALT